jgi:hypothetical protein
MAWMEKMLERLKVQLVMAMAMFPPSIFNDGEVSIFFCVFVMLAASLEVMKGH